MMDPGRKQPDLPCRSLGYHIYVQSYLSRRPNVELPLRCLRFAVPGQWSPKKLHLMMRLGSVWSPYDI